jgi:hypothetical protein
MLTHCRKVEANVKSRDQIAQSIRPEDGWGATTPMEMNDTSAPRVIGYAVDFPG